MNLFVDSSALVKRYVEEAGSDRVEQLLESATTVGASVLAPTEIVSALCRRRREALLSSRQYGRAKRALALDLSDFTIVNISSDVIRAAVAALERWPLRSADALHIGCAAACSAEVFVTADRAQVRAARAAGMTVEIIALN